MRSGLPFSLLTLVALTLAACGDKDSEGGDDTSGDGGSNEDVFSEIITVTSAPSGNLTCFTPGSDWLNDTPDPSCQGTAAVTGEVEDFETGDGVAQATVEIFYSDSISGSVDSSATSGDDGSISGLSAPSCTPLSYRTSTDPDLDETKVTIEAHQTFAPATKGTLDATFNSVSSDTYAIIPSLLGISVDPELGIIAGTAYDCDEEPIEGVQVIAKDANGEYPESQEIRYFVEEFPNRDQPETSEDGLWVAINIPPGRITIEMWGVGSSGAAELMGATELDVLADSINISNIKIGYGDGVFYPAECLSPCN